MKLKDQGTKSHIDLPMRGGKQSYYSDMNLLQFPPTAENFKLNQDVYALRCVMLSYAHYDEKKYLLLLLI